MLYEVITVYPSAFSSPVFVDCDAAYSVITSYSIHYTKLYDAYRHFYLRWVPDSFCWKSNQNIFYGEPAVRNPDGQPDDPDRNRKRERISYNRNSTQIRITPSPDLYYAEPFLLR